MKTDERKLDVGDAIGELLVDGKVAKIAKLGLLIVTYADEKEISIADATIARIAAVSGKDMEGYPQTLQNLNVLYKMYYKKSVHICSPITKKLEVRT